LIGVFAALGAAYAGTFATFLFREQTKYFSAIQINLIKSLIAFIIFSPTLFTIDIFSNYKNILFLLISGFIGISIGDSFYLTALKRIGSRRTLTIEALSPILANILGSLLINESISLQGWIGTLIVTLSLVGISIEKTVDNNYDQNLKKIYGFFYAIISVLCTVISAILARIVLVNSDFNPLQSSELRLLGSLLILIPYVRIDFKYIINSVPKKSKIKLLLASILGTNIELFLQQTVFKFLTVGLGWTLLSCAPAMSLLFAKAEGEKINIVSMLLTFTTIFGALIVLNA
tara:strand:- start:112 stop:978 length:867 start_codon:yes stop_codon:yes gene_type:complete